MLAQLQLHGSQLIISSHRVRYQVWGTKVLLTLLITILHDLAVKDVGLLRGDLTLP